MRFASARGAWAAIVVASVATVLTVTADGEAPAPRATATGEWRALAPATLERTEVAGARIGRYVYVVGGFEARSGLTTSAVERYDIRANRWRRLGSMPVGLNHATAAAYRGKVYVHGGYTARRDLSSATARLFAYDPRRDRWARLPKSRVPRAAHALAVVAIAAVDAQGPRRDRVRAGERRARGGVRRRGGGRHDRRG